MNKTIKIFGRIPVIVLASAVGIAMLAFITLLIPPIQNAIRATLADELTTLLNRRVEIGSLSYYPFRGIDLSDIDIYDSNQRALLGLRSANVDISFSSLWRRKIVVEGIYADSIYAVVRQADDGRFHFDIFTPDASDTLYVDTVAVDQRVIAIEIQKLRTRKGTFAIHRNNGDSLILSDINFDIDNIVSCDNYASVTINSACFSNHAADMHANLSGEFTMAGDTVAMRSLRANYGVSLIETDSIALILNGNDVPQFYADVQNVFVSTEMLQQLTGNRWKGSELLAQGNISGNADELHCSNVKIINGIDSSIEFDLNARNYNNIQHLAVDFDCKQLVTTADAIEKIFNLSHDEARKQAVGKITLSGTVAGPANQLVAEAALVADVGLVKLNATADIAHADSVLVDATLKTDGLDLSALTDGIIGKLDFAITANAFVAPDPKDNRIRITHSSNSLTFNDYAYNNLKSELLIYPQLSMGIVEINDPNGHVLFAGGTQMRDSLPQYVVSLHVDSLRTGRMNLTPTFPNGQLDMALRVETQGATVDEATGKGEMSKFDFMGNEKLAGTGRVLFDIDIDDAGDKQITIASSVLNGTVSGHFKYADLAAELYEQFYRAAGALCDTEPQEIPAETYAAFDIQYDSLSRFTQFIDDELVMSDSGSIRARIDARNHTSDLQMQLGNVGYGSFQFDSLTIIAQSGDSSLVLYLNTANLALPAVGDVGAAEIYNSLNDNMLYTDFTWRAAPEKHRHGALSCRTNFHREGQHLVTQIGIDGGDFVAGERDWTIAKSVIEIGNQYFAVDGFSIDNDERFIRVDGRASTEATDTLSIAMQKIVIGDFLQPDPYERFSLAGELSTTVKLNDLYNDVKVNCVASIDEFYVDDDRLEHLDVTTQWSPENERLDIDLSIVTDGKQRARGIGRLENDEALGEKYFDLMFDIDSISDHWLEFYLNGAIRDIKGTASGWLQIHGPLSNIGLDARLCMHRTEFGVKQTNVNYVFDNNDSIIISPNYIEFKNMRFVDDYGSQAFFYGGISHDMFSGLNIDIKFRTYDQLVFNLESVESPMYYGQIFANGLLRITGQTDNIDLSIDGTTSSNTVLYVLPLEKSDISETKYIKFKSNSTVASTESVKIENMPTMLEAHLNINITPEARIFAILDQRTDNGIAATGSGKLQLDVDKAGDLTMFGTYEIADGIYNFSFENILNKRFTINQGSTLTWDGEPYNCLIDLKATYKLKASLYDLVQNSDLSQSTDLKKRVPINCHIFLTDRIADPTIRFEIEIPSSQNFSQYTFDQYVNTEEEMNRQVFSLLLANRFYATEDATSTSSSSTSTGTYIGTTASELISNQLSNWLSQNEYNVGIGVNYRPGDEVTNEEYEVAMSTQILDNKILLSGNIGYGRDASSTGESEGSLIGDFDVEVKLNKKGNLRAKAYTHSNNDVIYETSPTTQGIGLSFNEDFNTFTELITKYWNIITGKRRRERKAAELAAAQTDDTEISNEE